jgi:hypothetical protein
MAIFTKQFANADDYEEWLAEASGRINVLSIENSPVPFGSTIQQQAGPVTLRYQTYDRSFAPPRSMMRRIVEVALVAAVFFALFLYWIYKV